MKRKLLTVVLLIALGHYYPDITERIVAWWQAPPSGEAQQIIASLETGDGWEVYPGDHTFVRRGNVSVVLGPVCANVVVNHAEAKSSFTYAELHQINVAAEHCLRRATARELNRVDKQATK